MKFIEIDIETKSDVDILKSGVYPYAESENFEVLLFAYSIDGKDVQLVDLANGEKIPYEILEALANENIEKKAFNVNFERVCMSKYLSKYYSEIHQGSYLNPKNWKCTMIHARTLSLPSSLAQVGQILNINDQKMSEGKALIKFFCVPYSYDGEMPLFHKACDNSEKWNLFKKYNIQDVKAELEIDKILSKFPVPEFIWEEFYIDQEINDRGISLDMNLVKMALNLDKMAKEKLTERMQKITKVENPNSVYQLLEWLESQGIKSDSLAKENVLELIKIANEPIKSVLEMRLQLSKSSVKKYTAMKNAVCKDDRARGMFSFYGAPRTGRFSGKLIQLQNLTRNEMPDLDFAREIAKSGNFEMIEMLYDSVTNVLSQLIRTAFVPKNGYKFIVADFSAIEARVLAWVAGESWRINAFANDEVMFVGKDVAEVLGYSNASKAVATHVDSDDKQFLMIDIADSQNGNVPIGQSKTALISKSGLYSLILSSKLPKCRLSFMIS